MVKEKLAGIRVKKVGTGGNGINSTPKGSQKDKESSVPYRVLELGQLVKESAITLIWLCKEKESAGEIIFQYKHIEEGTKLSYRTIKKVLDLLEAEGYITVSEVDYKNKKVELLF